MTTTDAGEPRHPDPEVSADPLAYRIVAVIAETQRLPEERITLDSSFEELGIDSLNGFNLLCDLEEALRITIPDDDARELASVREVLDRVRPLVSSSALPTGGEGAPTVP